MPDRLKTNNKSNQYKPAKESTIIAGLLLVLVVLAVIFVRMYFKYVNTGFLEGGMGKSDSLEVALSKAAEDCMIIEGMLVSGEFNLKVINEHIPILMEEFTARYGAGVEVRSGDMIPNTPGCYYIENGSEVLYQTNDGSFVTIPYVKEVSAGIDL